MRSVRVFAAAFLLLAAPSLFASAEFRILFDVDNRPATGCTVNGMAGVERVVTTVVETSGTPRVTSVSGQICTAGALGTSEILDSTGWPIAMNGTSGELSIETRVPASFFGGSIPAGMRLGFVAASGTSTALIIDTLDGTPILFPMVPSRRRIIGAGTPPVADGNDAEWAGVQPLAAGPNGTPSLRFINVQGWFGGNQMFFHFGAQSHPDAPTAVNDSYSTTPGTPITVAVPGVLSNDTDPRGRSLTAALVNDVNHGALVLNADGSFSYSDDGSGAQRDHFTYRASNGEQQSNVARVDIGVSSRPNTRPNAGDDTYAIGVGETLIIPPPGVLSNDNDPDADTITAILGTGPAHGTVTLNSNGSFTYVHSGVGSAADSFTYFAFDGMDRSREATVHLTISVNIPPLAVNDAYSVAEGGVLTVPARGVLTNDVDADGSASLLTASIVSGPARGTLSLSPNGGFVYVHNGSESTSDSFTYRAFDGRSYSNIATVTISITPVNDAPVAAGDSYTTAEDTPLNVPAPGVLGNDSDPEATPLTAILGTGPSNGTLTLNGNGSFLYTPNANFNGTDTFTYTASDGALPSAAVTVTITVTPVNDTPSFAVGGNVTVAEDSGPYSATQATAISAGPADEAGQTLTFNVSNNNNALFSAQPAIAPNGTLTFTPAANANGAATITVTLSDNGGGANTSAPQIFTITVTAVNDAPAFALAGNQTVAEDSGAQTVPGFASGMSAGPADEAGQTLSFNTTNDNNALFSVQPAVALDGTLTYTPAANAFGTATVSVTLSDNGAPVGSTTLTFTITVTPVNDLPIALADAYNTNEDTALVVAAPGVLTNDTDVEGALTAVLVSGPANGTLTLNADGSFTYTPNANFNGTDTFTYKANDGTADSGTVTVTITVNPVNDLPAAAADAFSTGEDTPLIVPAPGVLGNDTDVEGSPLTAILVSGPASGTLTLNANGSFTYTPNANFNGTDSFTYSANDGTGSSTPATVTITVTPVNDAPVAVADAFATNEDTALVVPAPGVLANDTDVDADPLNAILVSGTANGVLVFNANGSFTYTPNANFNGADSFTYKANDGTADSGTVTVSITINPVNDLPVAGGDAYATNEDTALVVAAPGILGNDTDVESSPLTAVLVSGPGNGTLTLNANGSFTYTPNANFNGSDSFTYQANDGTGNSNIATVTITVNPVADAPIAVNDAYNTNEDTALNVVAPGVLSNDSDPDADPITAILVSGPANGTLTLNPDGSFTYTPNANFNGSDSFVYKANDGGLDSGNATVTITVNPVNDAPVAADDSYVTSEDTPLVVAAPGVLANDTDLEGNPLTAVLVTGPASGALTLNASGSFTYTPGLNFNGSDSFTYRANDGSDSNTATVTITVTPVADAPVANNDSYATNEDTALNVSAPGVLSNDTDGDGNPLTAVLVTGPANGTLTLNPDGSFLYTPNANFNGGDSFVYKANDGGLDSLNATVTITVNPVNDAPTGVADAYNTFQNIALNVPAPGVLANDTDVEASPLTAVLVSGPANGTLTLNADGSFLYTPNAAYSGPDSFVYTANDGTANSANTTVSITVNPNTAPTATADAYATNEDVALMVAAPGVLSNDTDPEVPPQTLSAVLITGPSNGTLTLNANGSFTYTPAADFNGIDTFQYAANDGATNGNTVTVTITVNAVNDAPVLGGAGSTVSFTENGSAVTLEGALTVNDVDGGNLASAAVSITANFQSGADVLASTPVAGITASYNAGTGVLTFTGPAPIADFQTALRSVTYENTSENPSTTARTISWVANDGTANSNTVTTTVNVTAVNDAPVVTAGGSLNYTENQVATAIDTTITVNDVDNLNLTGATVTITGNLASTEDVLSYAPALGITGSYNAGTGTLTLTGTTTVANYQTALRNVLYNNTSENPSTLARTVTWVVNDGQAANNLSVGVTSTINVTAVNDAPTPNAVGPFAAQAGIPITFAAGTLGGTDVEPGTTVTVSTTPGTVTNGTVTLNADGSFTFTPSPASAGGTASFQYNVCDDGTPGAGTCSASPATVTLNVAGPSIYFVKISNVGLADCTLGNECALSTALGQIGANTNRRIFLGDNGSYTQSVSLNTNGWIIGQGVTGASFDAVFGIAPPGAGTLATRPLINQARPTLTNTVSVAGGARVRGLDISTTLGAALTEASVATINDVLINDASISATNNAAIILTDVTTLAATLGTLSSSSSPSNGISLTNVTGSITAGAGTLTNALGAVINVSGGSVGLTYSGNVSQGNNALLMSIGGSHTGTLTFNTGTVSATNGTGLQFSNADGTYQFQGTTTLNAGDAGVDITNSSTGTFTFNASTQIGNTSSPSGVAFHINNLNATTNVTYNGTINTTSNRPVHVQNVGANSVISFTGNVTSSSNGILLQTMGNPTSVTFSGASKSLNVGANTAVQMDGAAGNTVTFSGGGLVISRTTGAGIAASGGGTLIITGTGNIINSGSGTAVSVSSVTIGAGGLVFQSISQNGGASAIVLNNTGSTAGLTVSGNGGICSTSANCTGGAILNATADAISLTTTNSPSFTRMFIQNVSGSGIEGTGVVNFTFQNGVIDNVGTGGGANESNIAFKTSAGGLNENNVSGAVNILNNSLTNSRYHGIDILNYSGTISDLQITGNTLTSSTSAATSLGNAILVDINGNAGVSGNVTKGSISNNTISNFPSGAGIRVDSGNADAAGPSNSLGTPGNATNILNVTGNSISGAPGINMATQGINVTVSGKGQGNVNIASNNPVTNMNGVALACSGFGQVTLTCTINANTIVANNVLLSAGISAGSGQQFAATDTPDVTVTITGNNVSAVNGVGIHAIAQEGNAILKAKIQNNTVAASVGAGNRPGIQVNSGALANPGSNTVCLNISGNTSAGVGTFAGIGGIGLRKQGTATLTNVFGVNGMAATATPGVESYVNGLNPAGGGTLLMSATSGFSNCSLP